MGAEIDAGVEKFEKTSIWARASALDENVTN